MFATNYNQYNNDLNMYTNEGMFGGTCDANEPLTSDFDNYSSFILTYFGVEAYEELVANHEQEQARQNEYDLRATAEYYHTYVIHNEFVEDDYARNMQVQQYPEPAKFDVIAASSPASLLQGNQQEKLTLENTDKTTCPNFSPVSENLGSISSIGQVFSGNPTAKESDVASGKHQDLSESLGLSLNPDLPTELSVGKDGALEHSFQEQPKGESENSNTYLTNPELPYLTQAEAQHSINIAVASTVYLFHLQTDVAKNDRVNINRKLLDQILDGDLHTARYFAQWLQDFDQQAQALINNYDAIKRAFHATLMKQVLEQKNSSKSKILGDTILDNTLEFLEDVKQACYTANYGIALLEEVLASLKANKQREAIRKISSITTKLSDINFADESSLKEIANICSDTQTVITKSVSNNLTLDSLKTRMLTNKMQEVREQPFTFGLPAFDKVLTNGWRSGELMVIGAAPGIGKTALSLNLVMSRAAQLRKTGSDKKIMFFSLELTDLHVMDRLLKIQLNQLAKDAGNSLEDWNNFAQVVSSREKGELALCESLANQLEQNSSIYIVSDLKTIEDISHFVASTKARGVDIDFIVIDYLQNCRSSNPRYELDKLGLINHVSHTLTEIAKRNKTRVCALGLLRDGKFDHKNPPTGADLKESRQIEADADIIITLTKEIGGNFSNITDCLSCIENNVENGQAYANALNFMMQYSVQNTGFAYTIPSDLPRLDIIHVYTAKYRNGKANATSKLGYIGSLLSVCELANNPASTQHKAQSVSSLAKTVNNKNNNRNPKATFSTVEQESGNNPANPNAIAYKSNKRLWWR